MEVETESGSGSARRSVRRRVRQLKNDRLKLVPVGEEARRARIAGVVDTAATRLVLPGHVVKKLGLEPKGKVKVRYADGRIGKRDTVEGVFVEIQGRHGVFTAAVEPRRRDALIGAIILEDLDFLVDCTRQRLVPRDPKFIVSELE